MTNALNITARAKAIVAAALTIIALSFATPAAIAQTQDPQGQSEVSNTVPQQQVSQVQDQVRATLSQYGRFVQHQKYGEVWVPTVTPQGWHPYPPCNWVNTKQYGWYYDDKTPWGQIVHHYGRWVYDAQMGWVWTPGSEFSPAWVVWRTSPEWVGWAPMLPDEDVQKIAAADFNNAGYWIFVETAKFAQGCNGSIAPPSQVPVLLKQTTYVTDIQLVGGIVVFVLPQYVVGPIIVININFGPWPSWFLAQVLIDWNFMWNNLAVVNVVVYQNCAPKQIKPAQINNAPKPQPVNNPQPTPPPGPPPGPPPSNPPIIIVNPNPICPAGTAFIDGACRLRDPCRGGLIRIGNECVTPRPDPKPPIVVINDPCAKLTGGEFQRCIRGTPPKNIPIDKPPIKGPVAGTGDVKPVGNQPSSGDGTSGRNPHNPVGGSLGTVNPTVRPNVVFHPNGPTTEVKTIKDPTPTNRLPSTTTTPMRGNPNTVVLGPGGGGVSKTTVGSTPPAANNNAISNRRVLPMTLPKQGSAQTQTTIR
jgi:hypothetical protein